ncbi:MAG TPA: redoxin domain-containing protein [Gemmatimonadales bacterium]|nr:redoxin domain-containing protein [Gemmatimonadales bacterium]
MKLARLLPAFLLPGFLAAQGPSVGDVAPEWKLTVAGQDGIAAEQLSLSSLRGQVVVMAFFPKARTSGCTVQMKAYRDRHAELFGDDVALVAISRDTPEELAAWAADEKFPFRFASDADGRAGAAYGTLMEGRPYEARVLFVVGVDGKVAKVMRPFREIDPTAYDELKTAVAAARAAAATP